MSSPTLTSFPPIPPHIQLDSIHIPFNFDEAGYDYLSEPNENLICPICRNPFVDPVMCESTDHIFCRLCLIRSLEINSSCPIDRLPLSLSLLTPAPKIIFKLVDELMVACPFKQSRGCRFVCQRDLIAAHVHANTCLLPSASPEPPPPLPNIRPSSPGVPLRFNWHAGRATPAPSSHSHSPVISPPPPQSSPQASISSRTSCPFERFGCPYSGLPAQLPAHLHLSSDKVEEASVCRFAPVQAILEAFGALEQRNADLCAQLAHALAQRDELRGVLASCQDSLRQLWLAKAEASQDTGKRMSHTQVAVTCASTTRRSSDSAIHASRMNYDANGGRLAFAGPRQPLSAHSPTIRVSTFLRKGALVTPVLDPRSPVSGPQGTMKHSALPKILTTQPDSVLTRGKGERVQGVRGAMGELVGAVWESLKQLEESQARCSKMDGDSIRATQGQIKSVLERVEMALKKVIGGDEEADGDDEQSKSQQLAGQRTKMVEGPESNDGRDGLGSSAMTVCGVSRLGCSIGRSSPQPRTSMKL